MDMIQKKEWNKERMIIWQNSVIVVNVEKPWEM